MRPTLSAALATIATTAACATDGRQTARNRTRPPSGCSARPVRPCRPRPHRRHLPCAAGCGREPNLICDVTLECQCSATPQSSNLPLRLLQRRRLPVDKNGARARLRSGLSSFGAGSWL
jgi:hypothetical protein